MTLAPGIRLGPYEILAPLGAGGMGEVWRARDTKLEREVAVKVLPAHLAADEAARARFEREAKAVAALSHPNILAIHDFGLLDGVAYAVTELLAGQTLRERLAEGPLPSRKATQIGVDIARGLAAAHERGIVHRDLKPENIFVGTDGHVKILDFGLARQTVEKAKQETQAPTTAPGTDPGTVMGTVGYMSPEQVKGLPADHRSDIFSLGCVLYEMASGRRAFQRDTAAETMTAILREDPPDAPRDSAVRSAAFDEVVRHCLEKRPEERFQSARDLAFALQALSGSTTSGGTPVAAVPAGRPRLLPAVALVLGAVALFLVGRTTGGRGASLAGKPQVTSFGQITDQPGVETMPSLGPDGKSVVYARTSGTQTGLFLQRIGSRTAARLSPEGPGNDVEPAFSPDGERIAFRSDREGGGIFLMSASGESVTRLTDFGFGPSWSPDGTEIVVSPTTFISPTDVQGTAKGLSVVNVGSGRKRELKTNAWAMQPSWSPGGKRIAYWGLHEGGQRDIWTIAADGSDATGEGVPVTNDPAVDWSPTWAPDGRFLYFSSTRGGTMNLWRVPIDERSGKVLGEPEPVTTPSTWSGRLSFSKDGTRLAFASLDYRSTLYRVPFDAAKEAVTGPPVAILKGTRPIRDHELSPDGEWIAFTEASPQEDLFVARIDGSQYRRLTDDAFRDRGPAWSPDGARIAFYSDRSQGYELWTIRADGSGLTQVTEGGALPGFPVWSPDGAHLAYGGYGNWYVVEAGATKRHLTGPEPELGLEKTMSFYPFSWSPVGGRIAGAVFSRDGSRSGLMTYSVATKKYAEVPGALTRLSGGGWICPVWLSDGRRLVVRRPDGVAVVDADTGAGHMLFPIPGYTVGRSVGVSRDNRWITYTETATEGDIWIATIKR